MTWRLRWSLFWRNGRTLQMGWLVCAAIVALYVGAVRPHEILRGINNSKATGLASMNDTDPLGLWQTSRLAGVQRAVSGGFSTPKRMQKTTPDSAVARPPLQPQCGWSP